VFRLIPLKGSIENLENFFCGGVKAGLKEQDYDVGFIYSKKICSVAAIFTENRFKAAPLIDFERRGVTKSNFLLVNSKNANALTGEEGIEDIQTIYRALHKKFEHIHEPIMSSTGVIGVRLPLEKIERAIDGIDLSKRNSLSFARAIMTTDSYPKMVAFEVITDNGSFKIAGVAKGAGMIDPSMATMLAFIVTDASIEDKEMKPLLKECAKTTFNAISVDGDRSTNDTVLLFSDKSSNVYEKEAFRFALERVMHELALMIVRDGEGATKVAAFDITGAKNDLEAQIAAKALSNSLLVKTALFGEDPNWGRIASTIGACGIECYPERLKISFEDVTVYDRGKILFDSQREKAAHNVMKRSEFTIKCDLGVGKGSFRAYGCDLGYDYVKINAEYRT